MPVTEATHDLDDLTLTIKAEFAAPVERIWQIYADAEQLGRIWGPPGYPATFVRHELRPGGRMHYFMTSPEGDRYRGWWAITATDEPRSFEFDDGFAHDDTYESTEGMPVAHNVYSFEPIDGGTRATFLGIFESAEGLEKILEMGMIEGFTEALGQIDELVAEG